MTEETLKRAQELHRIIGVTRMAVDKINTGYKTRSYKEDRYYDDQLYSLNIGADYSKEDSLNLNRYMGNSKLIEVIRAELNRQLEEFEQEFAEL
ncbi:hypothetical protein EBB07_28790 [Paenibacillaceae bacterium]|nr:hypothetical protein EBB07_28790 [Paenibacillaceae bacterium]